MRKTRLCFFLSAAISGCSRDSAGGPLGLVVFDPKQHIASAEPLFSDKEERCATNPVFIMAATSRENAGNGIVDDKKNQNCYTIAKQIRAFTPISDPAFDINIPAREKAILDAPGFERNEMMDSLIYVSDRKCSRYTNFLKTYDGNINNSLGLASLITAGTAPLVSGEATAKTWQVSRLYSTALVRRLIITIFLIRLSTF